ncbi:MAG: holo-[acyl-carrier-protein] synthase [Planctomycetaceae bacterium]|nr:holo-[acyl-carrier-protein] synthase [Planctomycetaceae bacterium]|tara:strand:+ start:2285 stop:2677 length:393 start_codon:yes stop_codon:yes gene_type:complete
MNVIGLGTDIIECLRIAKMIEKHGELFLNRVYTSTEIAYCSSRKAANQSYAGRWAVKEAVLKAMGTGWSRGIRWKDIEVIIDLTGKPSVAIHGVAKEICEELGITDVLISLSHCRSHATATAIAVGNSID